MLRRIKNRKTGIRALSIITAACLLNITTANAQDGPDNPTDGGDLGGETNVPFDDGVGFLVAGGVCYGIWGTYNTKRQAVANKDEEAAI